jgi:hypothetical protein
LGYTESPVIASEEESKGNSIPTKRAAELVAEGVWGMSRIASTWRSFRQKQGQALSVVGGVALYVLFGLLLWWALDRYIQPTDSTQKKDLMQAWGFIMAGVAGGVGIYFTWRNQRLTQESLESTRESTEENLRLTREGQITERFTRAIEQLGATDDDGNKRMEIRLGGIYALERIAKDSKRDYPQIIDVLTAYIRENAPWPPKDPVANDDAEQADEALLPSDIQAVLTVIGRRAHYFVETRDIKFVDLRRYFAHRDVHQFIVNLRNTDLRGGNLSDAHLEGAVLYEAHLEGAALFGTHLEGATLWGAHLEGARLHGAYLKEAWVDSAQLEGADLYEAHLQRASLRSANLTGADLVNADLMDAVLKRANITGADFESAYNLTQKQVDSAPGDENTKLPDHLQRPAHWS